MVVYENTLTTMLRDVDKLYEVHPFFLDKNLIYTGTS